MVPGHPSWPHRPLGILPTRRLRRRRGSSPSLAPTSTSVNLLPGGEPSTRHSCANIYVFIDILLGIVYHTSLCCGIYPHLTTTTTILLLYNNNIITPYLMGGLSSDLLRCPHRHLMQCLHPIILYYYNIITSYLLGVLSSDLRWCLHQQLMQCLLSWVAETLLPSSWHAELLSIVRLMSAVLYSPPLPGGYTILLRHGMLNPSIRLMMALLYLLHFMGGTMSFTASFCYLHGKMMAPVLHRLILLSPWQDGGSFRHLAL